MIGVYMYVRKVIRNNGLTIVMDDRFVVTNKHVNTVTKNNHEKKQVKKVRKQMFCRSDNFSQYFLSS